MVVEFLCWLVIGLEQGVNMSGSLFHKDSKDIYFMYNSRKQFYDIIILITSGAILEKFTINSDTETSSANTPNKQKG